MMTEELLKEGKKARRNAKGTLTRTGNWLTSLGEAKRPEAEVRDALAKIEASYNELVIKHDDYVKLIDDDALFEEAENWMDECQGSYMNYVMRAKLYLESLIDQSDKGTIPPNPSNMIGISSVQSVSPVTRLHKIIPVQTKMVLMTMIKMQVNQVLKRTRLLMALIIPVVLRWKNPSYRNSMEM